MELILRGKINYDGKIINWYEISNAELMQIVWHW